MVATIERKPSTISAPQYPERAPASEGIELPKAPASYYVVYRWLAPALGMRCCAEPCEGLEEIEETKAIIEEDPTMEFICIVEGASSCERL